MVVAPDRRIFICCIIDRQAHVGKRAGSALARNVGVLSKSSLRAMEVGFSEPPLSNGPKGPGKFASSLTRMVSHRLVVDPEWERKQRAREYRVAARREKRGRKADEKKQRKLNATILRRMVKP